MAYTKKIEQTLVEKISKKEFKVKKNDKKANEAEIVILFDNDVEYSIVKLSTDDLDATFDGKDLVWINNFGVQDVSGNYVDVPYSVLIPLFPNGSKLVYHDGQLVRYFTGDVKDVKHGGKDMKSLDFKIGDPAVGWTKG